MMKKMSIGFALTALMTMAVVSTSAAQSIVVDEVIQSLLLEEAKVQHMQFDVVKAPGTADELRGTAKWRSGGSVQIVYTEDGTGTPLTNPVKEVANATSILTVDESADRSYWANSVYFLSGDLISMLRGVATDLKLIWVFSNGKTIIAEAPDEVYTIHALGGGTEVRLTVDLTMKVVTRIETHSFGVLKSTVDASGFALVESTIYLPGTVVVDDDVTDGDPPVTYTYSNYDVNPTIEERTFRMPQ